MAHLFSSSTSSMPSFFFPATRSEGLHHCSRVGRMSDMILVFYSRMCHIFFIYSSIPHQHSNHMIHLPIFVTDLLKYPYDLVDHFLKIPCLSKVNCLCIYAVLLVVDQLKPKLMLVPPIYCINCILS